MGFASLYPSYELSDRTIPTKQTARLLSQTGGSLPFRTLGALCLKAWLFDDQRS
jgi:hypothetical protein